MAAITQSVEIARRPEDVFAYLSELTRHGEWQEDIVSVTSVTDGPARVGTRATEVRRVGGREFTGTYEITEHDPPRRFGFRGIDGPVRPVGHGTLEPVGEGTRLTLQLDFEGHGLAGKLMTPLARGHARKQVPKDQQRLKERLESGTA
jgi:uncharacterized membrane protein